MVTFGAPAGGRAAGSSRGARPDLTLALGASGRQHESQGLTLAHNGHIVGLMDSPTAELVTLKTRVEKSVADELAKIARSRDRSVAAELRRAIDAHVTDARKDGRK